MLSSKGVEWGLIRGAIARAILKISVALRARLEITKTFAPLYETRSNCCYIKRISDNFQVKLFLNSWNKYHDPLQARVVEEFALWGAVGEFVLKFLLDTFVHPRDRTPTVRDCDK